MDDNDDRRLFPTDRRRGNGTGGGGDPPDDADELVAPGDIYATAGGQRLAIALRFIRKDGHAFTVPYAHLPLIWWQPPCTITIEYPGLFSVLLHGRELEELHRRLADQRITWVREFDEHRAVALSSAVTRMEILRIYPSREEGVAGDA